MGFFRIAGRSSWRCCLFPLSASTAHLLFPSLILLIHPLAPSLCRLAHRLHHWHACSGGRGLRRRLRSVLGASGQRCHGNCHHHTISFICIRLDWNIRSTSVNRVKRKTMFFPQFCHVFYSTDEPKHLWEKTRDGCSHDALFLYLFLWVSRVSAFTSGTLSRQRYIWQITLTNVAVHCGCEMPAGIRIKVHQWTQSTNSLTVQQNRHFIWSVTLGCWML